MPKRSRKGHYIGRYMAKAKRDTEPLSVTHKGFFDYVLDMYMPPSEVNVSRIRNGQSGLMQDKNRIRSYFQKAERKVGA